MWTDDYFKKVKKFRKDIAEFEGVLCDMPDEICEHTDELQYAIHYFRVALGKYTDFISTIHEIDKLYSDKGAEEKK